MISIIIGLVSIVLFVLVLLPIVPYQFLHLTDEIVLVLKGGIPLIVLLFGVLSVIVGITDIIDRKQARKETLLQEKFEKSA